MENIFCRKTPPPRLGPYPRDVAPCPGREKAFTEGFLRVLRSMGSRVALPRGKMFQR